MRILLDTDVNLDLILQRQPFYTAAKEIFVRLSNGEFEAYVCDITILNISFITRKELDSSQIRQTISQLLQLVKISKIDALILQKAITSPISDYEDAVQHESAIAENLDAIVTRNTKDFANASLKVYSPNEFLEFLKKL